MQRLLASKHLMIHAVLHIQIDCVPQHANAIHIFNLIRFYVFTSFDMYHIMNVFKRNWLEK